MKARGHLYVIDGNLTKVACDAWLLPTDELFSITTKWQHVFDETELSTVRSGNGSRRVNPRMITDDPTSLVIPFRDVDGVPVFLGKIGGTGEQGFRRAAREFLELGRKATLNVATAEHRRPVLALNHLGTGHGGARDKKWSALGALTEVLDELLSTEFADIDVVLVAWGSVAESASQDIRLQLCNHDPANDIRWKFHPRFHDLLMDKAHEIAGDLKSRQVSVFMGAGVSAGAGLKSWDDLLVDIGKMTVPVTTRTEIQTMHDNRDAAALLERRLETSGTSLQKELTKRLEGNHYSLQHGLLASLPCTEFITTNVDSLFEIACTQSGTTGIKEIPISQDLRVGDRWLLKLHGSVDREGSLVFTRDNYIDSFRSKRALMGLVQSMLLTRHMVFVGYGLRDEDFHELVYEVRSAFEGRTLTSPIGTVLALFEDEARSDLWKGIVDIVPMRPRPADGISDTDFRFEFQAAVRELERYLDLIGMLSVDTSKYILDSTYDTAGSQDPATEDLAKIVEIVRGKSHQSSAWRQLQHLLESLGADLREL